MTDRGLGINVLNTYKNESLLPPGLSLVEHFDKRNPGRIEIWGKMSRSVRKDHLTDQLKKLASNKGMALPSAAEINSAFMAAGATIDVGDVLKGAAEDAAKGLEGLLKSLGTVAVITAVAATLIIAFNKSSGGVKVPAK